MSENINPQGFEDLKTTYKLDIEKRNITEGIELIAKEESKSEPFIISKIGKHKFEFTFNPGVKSENFITFRNSYPESVPERKKILGITNLYHKLFLSYLNRDINEAAGGKSPDFPGTNGIFVANPFNGKESEVLMSASVKATFLSPDGILNDPSFTDILRHVETKIAKDSTVLGLSQLEFDLQSKPRGESEVQENRKYILLIVKGKFANPKRDGKFDEEDKTMIVSRKIEGKKSAIKDDELLSKLSAYIATVKALQNPYRG